MKQNTINQAYVALGKLSENSELGVKDQWNIYNMRKILRSYVEFYEERRAAIRKKYTEFADDDGNLIGQKAVDFQKENEEILNLDVDIEAFKKISLNLVKGIQCKDIESLENFVDFIPPESE